MNIPTRHHTKHITSPFLHRISPLSRKTRFPVEFCGALVESTTDRTQTKRSTTHQEIITVFKLGLDLLAQVTLWQTQVLPQVSVLEHQGHEAVGDVQQLGRERAHLRSAANASTRVLSSSISFSEPRVFAMVKVTCGPSQVAPRYSGS